jgi:hypothetical protein
MICELAAYDVIVVLLPGLREDLSSCQYVEYGWDKRSHLR